MASKPHASPPPPAVFLVATAPRALAHTLLARGSPSTSRSLLFSSKASTTCAFAGEKPQARAALGSGVGLQTRGAALHPGVPRLPHPLRVTAGCSFLSSGQQELSGGGVGSRGVSRAGSVPPVCSWHTQHESSPKAKPRPWGWMWGRDVAAPLRLRGQTQSPCSPGLPPRL